MTTTSRNIKLTIEYDGGELCGWQRQANGPTVQQHLEEAIAEMTGSATTLYGASRTDAGVHALGQVANFHTQSAIPTSGFRMGLNVSVPRSIAVIEAIEVPENFNARFSARGKHYRYTIVNRRDHSPIHRRSAWHRRGELDLVAMRAAANHLLGERDFAAFRASGCSAETTNRRIDRVDIERGPGDLISIDVVGNAFLRNMVRIVAGTLVAVGEGKIEPGALAEILSSGDRARAGPTAPAHGLCLVRVYYPT